MTSRALLRLTYDQLAEVLELPPDVVVGVEADAVTDTVTVRMRGVGQEAPEGTAVPALEWPLSLRMQEHLAEQRARASA